MEQTRKLLGLSGGHPLMPVPGRVTVEWAEDSKKVKAKVFAAVVAASQRMGINMQDEKAALFATEEAIKKIMKEYPSAMVDDIVTALEMASFKEIELENQLHGVSAANIFGWYKKLRLEFSHKMKFPQAPAPSYILEPTEEEKKKLSRQFFQDWVFGRDVEKGGFEKYWGRLLELGVLKEDPTAKRSYFAVEANKAVLKYSKIEELEFAFPIFSQRKLAKQFLKAWREARAAKGNFGFSEWKDNPLFKLIAQSAKEKMASDAVEIAGRETVMKKYDEKFG